MKTRNYYLRRTKIICTLGPASETPALLTRLVKAGMDIARLNLSHGTLEEHARRIKDAKAAARKLDQQIAILMDLPGPKYRIGELTGGEVTLKKGHDVYLTTEKITGDETLLPVTLPNLADDMKVGAKVMLDDGELELKVTAIEKPRVKCRVIYGGKLLTGKGLVAPGIKTSIPFMTDTLRDNILFAISQKPDYIALSFVTEAKNIEDTRAFMKKNGANIPIISKIEHGEAVRNFNEIMQASDGIMIARGDLGVETPLEKVPFLQKELIKKCNRAGKPVITATEMLESMIVSPRPTRAEATDVANAIFDGTDAIMLSGETSVGKYPVQVVDTMSDIAREAEKKLPYEQILSERLDWLKPQTDELISYSACQIADSLKAAAIVAFTQSGSTAMRISRFRPGVPVIALTPDADVTGRLILFWGIRPYLVGKLSNAEQGFELGAFVVQDTGLAKPGDLIIIAAGVPIGQAGTTNMLRVERITEV